MNDLISVLFTGLLAFSLWPCLSYCIANNPRHDDFFQKLFSRPDNAVYFTDDRLVHLRIKFEKEYRPRLMHAVMAILVMAAAITILAIKKNESVATGIALALTYIVTSVIVFWRLGAAAGRLEATMPLTSEQRRQMEVLISQSDFSQRLVDFLNSNPKQTLAYIDFLNLKYESERLQEEQDKETKQKKLSGLVK